MTLVRIVRNWTGIDLMRQSPGGRGEWDGIRFTEEPVEACDYLLVSNYLPHDVTVTVPPTRIWSYIGEPPRPHANAWHRAHGTRWIHRIFTVDPRFQGPKYVHAQPALPWWVERSYDALAAMSPPQKPRRLSWITSAERDDPGRARRMAFCDRLRTRIDFDLFGRGFTPVGDKWDALQPYRYSLAIENDATPWYWSEKIADCFLAWTMPIYWGCDRIGEYFPAEAFFRVEIDDPDAPERIAAFLAEDPYASRREAIAEARRLVLERYQLFPFWANQIRAWESQRGATAHRERVTLRAEGPDVRLAGGRYDGGGAAWDGGVRGALRGLLGRGAGR
jgi:hypothetical protein